MNGIRGNSQTHKIIHFPRFILKNALPFRTFHRYLCDSWWWIKNGFIYSHVSGQWNTELFWKKHIFKAKFYFFSKMYLCFKTYWFKVYLFQILRDVCPLPTLVNCVSNWIIFLCKLPRRSENWSRAEVKYLVLTFSLISFASQNWDEN